MTRLDDQVKVALVAVERRRGVAPHDLFAVDLGHDGDVLSDGEAERVVRVRQAEAVQRGIVRERFFRDERERAPFDRVKHLARHAWDESCSAMTV